ncbi:hypothetical protein [Amycolatopsis sp. DG1A-15b]|uniref:hypothetical protein n=1 Tax=Amycolatopsis sp. DG1A-15b TaxID=3052846 RepID=UPI00255B8E01|nr:hypothetical protein [Amycolatopsis sp. DG1A-15b]WIX92787.1 hypothetical protein QRY02_21025 [Amycolatopsis sp. DG1A-15b]
MHELSDQELVAESNQGLFTRAAGFEVEFFARGSSTALRFTDGHRCQIAGFPWWEDVCHDLRSWTMADVPLGDVSQPYSDLDQCWRILIWQHADRVYIAESADESPFHSLYWVTAAEYASAWTDALARARAMPT